MYIWGFHIHRGIFNGETMLTLANAYLRQQSNTVLTDQDYVDILTEEDMPIEVQKTYLRI